MDIQTGLLIVNSNPDFCEYQRVAPGSVMKLVTSLALLAEQESQKDKIILCEDRFYPAGRHLNQGHLVRMDALSVKPGDYLTCSLRNGHGTVNMSNAIAHSCSVYFYRMLQDKDIDFVLNMAKEWELIPQEYEWKSLRPLDKYFFAIGEHDSLKLTPAQILSLSATIANRGHLLALQNIDELDVSSSITMEPKIKKQISSLDSFYPIIIEGMRQCVAVGTAKVLNDLPFEIAAKTGSSSQKQNLLKTDGVITGFFPLTDPRFAFVLYKQNCHGSMAAQLVHEFFHVNGREIQQLLDSLSAKQAFQGETQ